MKINSLHLLILIPALAFSNQTFGQSPKAPKEVKKFLKTNEEVSLYFHKPYNLVITEDQIESWDWNNYTIKLKVDLKSEFEKRGYLKYYESDLAKLKVKNQLPSLPEFSICADWLLIANIKLNIDTVNYGSKMHYVENHKLAQNSNILQVKPNIAEFKRRLEGVRATQADLVDKALKNSKMKDFVIDIMDFGGEQAGSIIIKYLQLYDHGLKEYLIKKKLLVNYN